MRTHLDEAKIDSINKAATLADDYSLTHKLSYTSAKPNYSNRKPWQNKQPSSHPQASTNYRGEKPRLDTGTYNKASDSSGYRNFGKASKSEHELNCTYCKKPGHLVSRCWKLHGKPNACVVPQRATTVKAQTKPVKLVTEVSDDFKPFVMQGHVSLIGDETNLQPIVIMRDTGCAQTLILEDALPLSEKSYTNTDVLIKGVGMEYSKVPLHKILLKSGLVSGLVTVGVRPKLPIEGVSMLLGNDLAGVKVIPDPIVTTEPSVKEDNEEEKKLFPACAITRAMTKQISQEEITDVVKPTNKTPNRPKQINEINLDLEDTFFATLDDSVLGEVSDCNSDPITRTQLIREQDKDPKLTEYIERSLPSQEAEKIPVCFYTEDGILMRKWRPPEVSVEDEWQVIHQIVVPQIYHREVISLAHDNPMAGHLGISKTHDRILAHFWWPTLRKDVTEYCKSCHTCQIVGKPNQKIPPAPLKPIPAFEEPFSRIIIDCVGPLPKTKSGNQYLLTVMCASTRFPEAIPLRNIKARTIVKALIKFFTLVGLPKSIQSDQGSNFMSGLFQQVMHELGILQYKSSAYHPQSQGALERFHQTLKNMMRTFCSEFPKDWDEGVHLLLFAAREAVQESLGF